MTQPMVILRAFPDFGWYYSILNSKLVLGHQATYISHMFPAFDWYYIIFDQRSSI